VVSPTWVGLCIPQFRGARWLRETRYEPLVKTTSRILGPIRIEHSVESRRPSGAQPYVLRYKLHRRRRFGLLTTPTTGTATTSSLPPARAAPSLTRASGPTSTAWEPAHQSTPSISIPSATSSHITTPRDTTAGKRRTSPATTPGVTFKPIRRGM